jgi:long-chain acyl-CoA synthetase
LEGVTHTLLVGDGKPYLAALLAVRPESLAKRAERLGIPGQPMEQLFGHPQLEASLLREIEEHVNPLLAGYQRVRAVALLPTELSVEAGELTPTLKKRREEILGRYRAEVERLYPSPLAKFP